MWRCVDIDFEKLEPHILPGRCILGEATGGNGSQ